MRMIARQQGVSHSSISQQMKTIRKRLKKALNGYIMLLATHEQRRGGLSITSPPRNV